MWKYKLNVVIVNDHKKWTYRFIGSSVVTQNFGIHGKFSSSKTEAKNSTQALNIGL